MSADLQRPASERAQYAARARSRRRRQALKAFGTYAAIGILATGSLFALASVIIRANSC